MMLDPNTACALIFKLRRLHGKEAAGPDVLASNDVDEGQPHGSSMDDTLVEGRDDGNALEVAGLVRGLGAEQQIDLAALILRGRDGDAYGSFDAARGDATDLAARIGDILLNDPAIPEHLAAGLEAEGFHCDGLNGAA